MNKVKRITLSRENRVIAGVAGGIGEYFCVDPVLIRLAWIIFATATVGAGIIAYLAAWVIMPEPTNQSGGGNSEIEQVE